MALGERKLHGQNEPTVLVAVLEAARAIAEAAFTRRHPADGCARAIEHADTCDGVADFLAVRAHVLDRRCPDLARDAGQAFEAGPATRHREGHPVVPGLSRADPG